MLFYESAKCLHGRMRTLKGKYYGSVFVHYMPVDRSIWDYTIEVNSFLQIQEYLFNFLYNFLGCHCSCSSSLE